MDVIISLGIYLASEITFNNFASLFHSPLFKGVRYFYWHLVKIPFLLLFKNWRLFCEFVISYFYFCHHSIIPGYILTIFLMCLLCPLEFSLFRDTSFILLCMYLLLSPLSFHVLQSIHFSTSALFRCTCFALSTELHFFEPFFFFCVCIPWNLWFPELSVSCTLSLLSVECSHALFS